MSRDAEPCRAAPLCSRRLRCGRANYTDRLGSQRPRPTQLDVFDSEIGRGDPYLHLAFAADAVRVDRRGAWEGDDWSDEDEDPDDVEEEVTTRNMFERRAPNPFWEDPQRMRFGDPACVRVAVTVLRVADGKMAKFWTRRRHVGASMAACRTSTERSARSLSRTGGRR